MGGKALKSVITRRYQKQEYSKLVLEILPKIEELTNSIVAVPKEYVTKADFGDLDVLILNDGNLDLRKVAEELGANEIQNNGGAVYSFDYKEFQIDLIPVTPSNWASAQFFYSYGDLGNCLGKITYNLTRFEKDLTLKFGWDGLKLIYNPDGRKYELNISRNPTRIKQWFGMDLEKDKLGYNDPMDLIATLYDTQLFSSDAFVWENMNSVNKHRNKKRPGFTAIVDAVEQMPEKEFHFSRIELLGDLSEFFGVNIQGWINEMEADNAAALARAAKFNGKMIMEKYPHLQGKELGDAIKGFKEYILEGTSLWDFDSFVDESTSEKIMKHFDEYYISIKQL